MRKLIIYLATIAAPAILLTSCAAPSNAIGTPGLVGARITRGVTTESDLVAQLGPPQGRGLDAKGRTLLTWNRIEASATKKASIPVAGPFLPGSVEARKYQLAVSLDSVGKVADYKYSGEVHPANIFGTTDEQ
jgi:hypothetical protein